MKKRKKSFDYSRTKNKKKTKKRINKFIIKVNNMNSRKTISSLKDIESSKENSESNRSARVKIIDHPTFILKTREGENRAISPSQRNGNKYVLKKHL